MTVKEALFSVIEIKFNLSDGEVNKALIDRDLNGDDMYSKEQSVRIDLAAVDVLLTLFGLSSFSEGDMSISYDREGLKARLLFLAKKHGLTSVLDAIDPKPKVSGVRRW